MLAKKNRIRLKKEFDQIFKTGQSFYGNFLGVKAVFIGASSTRVGIIVGSKVSKLAVDRNLIKRRIRDVIKLELDKLKDGFDIAVILLPSSINTSFTQLKNDLILAIKRLNLYK